MRVALGLAAALVAVLVFTSHLAAPTPTAGGSSRASRRRAAASSAGASASHAVDAPAWPPPAPPLAGPRGTFVTIVYGGNLQGEVEPCG